MAELLSIQEVAEITQLHEITIRRYIQSGKLAAVRIGRRIRVPREALDTLLRPVQPEQPATSQPEQSSSLKEGAVAYEAASSQRVGATLQAAVGGVATQLVQLPAEDIFAVAQLVTRLRQRRQSTPQRRLSPAEIVAAAREQARLLSDVPRAEIAARLEALAEEIRQQAITQDTAIEGDWLGD